MISKLNSPSLVLIIFAVVVEYYENWYKVRKGNKNELVKVPSKLRKGLRETDLEKRKMRSVVLQLYAKAMFAVTLGNAI